MGHHGIEGNEKADRLIIEGAGRSSYGPEPVRENSQLKMQPRIGGKGRAPITSCYLLTICTVWYKCQFKTVLKIPDSKRVTVCALLQRYVPNCRKSDNNAVCSTNLKYLYNPVARIICYYISFIYYFLNIFLREIMVDQSRLKP